MDHMQKYIGTKVLLAMPMTLGAYNIYRGWDMPLDEDPNREGYLVEYEADADNPPNQLPHEGYVSWSPKAVFEKTYNQNGQFTFGQAICAMRAGQKVTRLGWNGSNMFVYLVPAAKYPAQRNTEGTIKGVFPDDLVPYREYFALKTAQNDVAMWSPSGSDALANDWAIVE